jgi:hypothetical protein
MMQEAIAENQRPTNDARKRAVAENVAAQHNNGSLKLHKEANFSYNAS